MNLNVIMNKRNFIKNAIFSLFAGSVLMKNTKSKSEGHRNYSKDLEALKTLAKNKYLSKEQFLFTKSLLNL